MRRKIVMTLAIIAIIWGLTIGIKSVEFEDKNEIRQENFVYEISENYIDELNLPLIEVDTLNPLKTTNSQVASILGVIYEPLVEFESDEKIKGVLLEEWAKLDSKNWILKIKDDVLWHNGKQLTANDVVYTFNILMNKHLIYTSNLESVKEIIKLDSHSVRVVLKEADDYFIGNLNFPIISEEYFKNDFDMEERAKKPMGTGPYKYVTTDSDGNIELEFNSSWWKEKNAKLKKINLYNYASFGEAIKAFKSAKVDMIVTNMSKWKEKFGTIGLNAYCFENSEYEMIIPNCNNGALTENSVRRAILQAINRENIINSVYNDNASISDIPLHTNSRNSVNNTEYNLEKAKQILINAGWETKENGWQKEINGKHQILDFTLLVNNESDKKKEVAEKIKNNLEELGIKINIKTVSKEALKEAMMMDQFELVLTSIDIKNEYFIQNQIIEESERNYANYKSAQMEKIIEEMSVSDEAYNEKIHSLTQLYKNDAPYIGLYFKTSTMLTNKSVKGNFEPTWSNFLRNITSFCK